MIKTTILRKHIINEVNVNKKLVLDNIPLTLFKTKGNSEPEILHEYKYNGFSIYVIGWKDGLHNQINKHDMPPPLDVGILYGDLLLLKIKKNEVYEFTKSEYLKFYEKKFGGFEDLNSTDTDTDYEGEIIIDEDYVPGKSDESEEEIQYEENISEEEEEPEFSSQEDTDSPSMEELYDSSD